MSIADRLCRLADKSGWDCLDIVMTYMSRRRNLEVAYGSLYEGRESHLSALAYRGTEMHYLARKNLKGYIIEEHRVMM